MALRRYDVEVLLHLRESPLCTKPSNLPPAEEWMGAAVEKETGRIHTKTVADRAKNGDHHALLDHTNRRTAVERARNTSNPDDIILGPPRTTFSSATLHRGSKAADNDKALKEPDSRDRFSFRARNGTGEGDASERARDRIDRDVRPLPRRRGENDHDTERWTSLQPRKSFGHEGAERFSGTRIGEKFGGGDRERRPRDNNQEERDSADRPLRKVNFGEYSKDKDGGEAERPRKNGLHKNRSDQPLWTRGDGSATTSTNDAPAPRERFDRAKSWRERERDRLNINQGDAAAGITKDRNQDRRWDRDSRREREPEWFDEGADDQTKGHTEADLKQFLERMKAGKAASSTTPTAVPTGGGGFTQSDPSTALTQPAPTAVDTEAHEHADNNRPRVSSVPAVDLGPDKFFANFGQTPSIDVRACPLEGLTPKPKGGSRFQNFFSNQEDRRPSVSSPGPATNEVNPLLAFAGLKIGSAGTTAPAPAPAPEAAGRQGDMSERMAFQALLQKLQTSKQSVQGNTPGSTGSSQPPTRHNTAIQSSVTSPSSLLPAGHDHADEQMGRGRVAHKADARPQPQIRAEQQQYMLQSLLGQRQAVPGQNVARADAGQNRDFLLNLMQSAPRPVPEPARPEQMIRMPLPPRSAQMVQTPDREPDYSRDRNGGRPHGMPGYFDDSQLQHPEQHDNRRQQPTQILQRHGLQGVQGPLVPEPMQHVNWMHAANQQLAPGPGRSMVPPPGLGGSGRNGPMPTVFPQNAQMGGNFVPTETAAPQRNHLVPPPGFYNGPPPPVYAGMPPPGIAGPFQAAQEPMAFGFDGRGMPPPGIGGAFRRN